MRKSLCKLKAKRYTKCKDNLSKTIFNTEGLLFLGSILPKTVAQGVNKRSVAMQTKEKQILPLTNLYVRSKYKTSKEKRDMYLLIRSLPAKKRILTGFKFSNSRHTKGLLNKTHKKSIKISIAHIGLI